MIRVDSTAIRAWVQPGRKRAKRAQEKAPWRSQRFGERVLVWDTETTTDYAHRLQFGVYRLYAENVLETEGIFIGNSLTNSEQDVVLKYAQVRDVPVLTRDEFMEQIFFREIYELGTLCVGFNLPFDLSRIAISGGIGRGRNRRKFRLEMSKRIRIPAIYVEAISSKSAFIQFTTKKFLATWEKPFFRGRFLDLSTLAWAFTGERFTLKRAAKKFRTAHKKSHSETLGTVTEETLDYARNDVLVTW